MLDMSTPFPACAPRPYVRGVADAPVLQGCPLRSHERLRRPCKARLLRLLVHPCKDAMGAAKSNNHSKFKYMFL